MSSDIITGGKTIFEDKLFDALLDGKDREFRDSGHVYSFPYEFHTYEFRLDGSANRGLPKKISVYGPVYERSSKPKHPMSYLGYLDVETGKIKAGRGGKDGRNTEYAVDAWLAKRAGIAREQLGWDVSTHEGWARVFKRLPGKPYKREVAILAAAMPARHIDYYNPAGTRQIGYPDYQKLNIPASVLAYTRKKFEDANVFEDLYQSSRVVNRRVSAWEDGPGSEWFHGKAT